MRVDFIRHGIALIAETGQDDTERKLSERGLERTVAIAKTLRHHHYAWPLILTSPLRRAEETANIFRKQGLSDTVEILPSLAPGGEFNDLVLWQQANPELGRVALIGHQPDLSHWVEIALWGEARGVIQLKKAGIACVEFPDGFIRAGQGILLELLTPKSLLRD